MFGNFFESVGNFTSNAFSTLQNVVGDVSGFVAELPGEIVSFGQQLGNTIFGAASSAAEQVEEGSRDFQEAGAEFRARQAGAEAGSRLRSPIVALAFVLGLTWLGSQL